MRFRLLIGGEIPLMWKLETFCALPEYERPSRTDTILCGTINKTLDCEVVVLYQMVGDISHQYSLTMGHYLIACLIGFLGSMIFW